MARYYFSADRSNTAYLSAILTLVLQLFHCYTFQTADNNINGAVTHKKMTGGGEAVRERGGRLSTPLHYRRFFKY